MRLYYIAPPGTMEAKRGLFFYARAEILPNGEEIVTIREEDFISADTRVEWESIVGVVSFPHPLSMRPVGGGLAGKLSSWGVVASDSVYDAMEKLGKNNPHFRL